MEDIKVIATDTQGRVYTFDKPEAVNTSNDPFLFGLKRGREESAAEISRLQGENERLSNLIGDRDAEIATAFEQGRIFGNGEVEDKIQTAEQRVARECVVEVDNEPEYPDDAPPKLCQILTKAMDERDLDLLLHAMRQTVRLTKECIGERIKAKYHLEDE